MSRTAVYGKHILLVGLRGVDKTVLLNQACEIAKKALPKSCSDLCQQAK